MTRSATPGEPETEAGRRLHGRLWAVSTYEQVSQIIAFVGQDILAIEVEARAESSAEMERLRRIEAAARAWADFGAADGSWDAEMQSQHLLEGIVSALGDSR